ncbi:hypothetical protein [Hyphomonas sp. GM-8P]|jgi:hypothetical protein|uniref:hypothetical protein n=1 Tax=Alphaproteobacteria TaxID=28211 RepID=UPI000DBF572D|nr:hypothetical protein [Hyphomonas sp. GM-8P]MBO6690035.1 hypothetical protein [Henriciella sp.]RAN38185.1 hypothetical protein HY26_18275 [Hyphomonas sp. GM-8P]|tara:strand:+ start:12841 stop:13269 length:429 start_codon:yes stop_codon:yes gene_type:complete
MGHHRKQHGHATPRYAGPRGGEGRPDHDRVPRQSRIPLGLIAIGLVVWSGLGWGVYLLVDPVLAWLAGSVGPLTDAGTGIARWFGFGQQAAALRDVANVEVLIGQVAGPMHFIVKAGLILLWLAGLVALVALPVILRRRSRW